MKIYVAHAMTGRKKSEVLAESRLLQKTVEAAFRKVELLDPVVLEGVKGKGKINSTPEQIREFWRRDKEMIRRAHVVIDLTGPMKSEGVAHEIGYARYCLWKPVIRVYPGLSKNSVAFLEDDMIARAPSEALLMATRHYGTVLKRLLWRVKMLRRSFFKWLRYQLGEFK